MYGTVMSHLPVPPITVKALVAQARTWTPYRADNREMGEALSRYRSLTAVIVL